MEDTYSKLVTIYFWHHTGIALCRYYESVDYVPSSNISLFQCNNAEQRSQWIKHLQQSIKVKFSCVIYVLREREEYHTCNKRVCKLYAGMALIMMNFLNTPFPILSRYSISGCNYISVIATVYSLLLNLLTKYVIVVDLFIFIFKQLLSKTGFIVIIVFAELHCDPYSKCVCFIPKFEWTECRSSRGLVLLLSTGTDMRVGTWILLQWYYTYQWHASYRLLWSLIYCFVANLKLHE